MGKRGPPKEPTKLKLLKGNPGRRPINDKEPPQIAGKMKCPAYLTGEGRKCWKDVAGKLEAMGLESPSWEINLALLCSAFDIWQTALKDLKKRGVGRYMVTDSGYVAQHPAINIAAKARGECFRYLRDLGLTPSAVSSIRLPEPEARDEVDEFFKKHGT